MASATESVGVYEIFIDDGAGLTSLLAVEETAFVNKANIAYSPTLTKVVGYGSALNETIVRAYHIDYTTLTYEAIDFPTHNIFDPENVFILINDAWLYLRQLPSPLASVGWFNEEFIYAIEEGIYPVEVSSYPIDEAQESVWVYTAIETTATGDVNIYTQYQQADVGKIVLEFREAIAEQVYEAYFDDLSTFIVNG